MNANDDLRDAISDATDLADQIQGWCLGLADHCADLQDATKTKGREGFLDKLGETVDDSEELTGLIEALEEARDRAIEARDEIE